MVLNHVQLQSLNSARIGHGSSRRPGGFVEPRARGFAWFLGAGHLQGEDPKEDVCAAVDGSLAGYRV